MLRTTRGWLLVLLAVLALTAAAINVPQWLRGISPSSSPAATVFPGTILPDAPWEALLKGDAAAGERLFFDAQGKARCGECHRIGERGGTTAPNLTGAANMAFRQLVESILDPNAILAPHYGSVLVVTTDGRVISGMGPVYETDKISILTDSGQRVVVPRSEVDVTEPFSAMPSNYAQVLAVQELLDILAYLRSLPK